MYYNKTSTAKPLPKKKGLDRIKPIRQFKPEQDGKAIEKYLNFFTLNPNWNRMQLQAHINECGDWMSLLDHCINDCEHYIALSTMSEADPATLKRAYEILTLTLGFRMRLKAHRQECLNKENCRETVLDGERKYVVRTLFEQFGHEITIDNNRMVVH